MLKYKLKRTKKKELITVTVKFNNHKIKMKYSERMNYECEDADYILDWYERLDIEDIYDLFDCHLNALDYYIGSKLYIDNVKILPIKQKGKTFYSNYIKTENIKVLINGEEFDLKKLLGITNDTNNI